MGRESVTNALLETQKANGMHSDAHARPDGDARGQDAPLSAPPAVAARADHRHHHGAFAPENSAPHHLATVPHLRGLPMTQDPKLNSHSNELQSGLHRRAKGRRGRGGDAGCAWFREHRNACNFFIVRKDQVWTSTGDYCMNGITRQKVIDLCRANDIPVYERNFSLVDTYSADEAFLTGTPSGAQTPVGTIDGRTIGTGQMGPMTERLRDLYKAMVGA